MTRDDLPPSAEPAEPVLAPAAEARLEALLRAAWSPGELDPKRNQALIELALEDPLAPPTDAEIVESERLRRALDGEPGDTEHPDAALARALRAAAVPHAGAAPQVSLPAPRAAKVYVLFGAAAAVCALAAAVAIVLRPALDRSQDSSETAAVQATPATQPALRLSRSTQELFTEKFEPGQASARIDRIAQVRERELRSNRYALWGVR